MRKSGWGPWLGLSLGYLRTCRTRHSLGLKGVERAWSSQRCCVVSYVRHEEVASNVRLIKARQGEAN